MVKLDVLTEEHIRICAKVGIDPKGYGLRYMDESKMVLKHFVTGFEVMISREGVKSW